MSATVDTNSVAKSSAAAGEDRYDTLHAERDRFVALAFCNADLLLELDASGRIMFACGATKLLLGRTPEQLKGHAVAEIIATADRNVVARLLRRAKSGGRLDNMRIKLAGINGPTPPVTLSGYSLADMGGQMYLAMRVEAAAPTPYMPVEIKRDEASGILDRDTFSDAAGAAMRAANDHGEEVELTLIQLGDWEGLESRLEDEARDELLSNIGACLRASSVTGDAAGRLDGRRYGLGPVDIHLSARRQPARCIIAAKLVSVFSYLVAMRPELLEIAEEILDEMAPFVHREVARDRAHPIGLGWNDGHGASAVQFGADPVDVEGLVGQQGLEVDTLDQRRNADAVVALAGKQQEARQVAERIDGRDDFRRQPASRSADGLILSPPLAPVPCWWTRTMVPAVMAYSKSGSGDNSLNRLSNTPFSAHRRKRR